jgi:rhodanese-related sulfurtransferase
MSAYRRTILTIVVFAVLGVGFQWSTPVLAQQQPRYPVDPQTGRAVGAKQLSANELKRHLDAHNKVLLVEVREPGKFNETIPGATNIPFDQLEGRLKSVPKDTYLVFTCGTGRTSSQAAKLAEELGFKSTTFCPVNQWKEQGYQAEPRNK